jgi:hypothetical protein
MRDLVTGDCNGFLTLFLETGAGLHQVGHITRDSSGVPVEIRVNENSFPFIHDWNEDGRKDLVLGEGHYNIPDTGNVRIYLNEGTNSHPSFCRFSFLLAGGQLLFHPRTNPTIYDLDLDSLKDLVLGNDNGYIYFYQNVGTNSAPVFNAEYETLQTQSGTFIDALTESRLRMLDWNGDGDLDLLLGGQDGSVWIYENATDLVTAENGDRTAVPVVRVSPNPFRHAARISAGIRNESAKLRGGSGISIYDAAGRLVRSFALRNPPYAIRWAGTDQTGRSVPAGVYFVRIDIDGREFTKQIIKLR